MKFTTTPALLVLVAVSAAALYGQTAPTQKLGIIDMQSALVATKDGQKAVADLRSKFGPKDQALQKRQADLQSKQDQYRRTQNTISEDAKAALERDIDSMTRTYQRDSQDAKDEMDEDQQLMISNLGGKLMQVLSKYATDNHYTMVFDVSGQPNNILFASSAIDITREIIAIYDKENPGAAAAPASATAAPPKPAGPSGAVQRPPAAAPRAPAASAPK